MDELREGWPVLGHDDDIPKELWVRFKDKNKRRMLLNVENALRRMDANSVEVSNHLFIGREDLSSWAQASERFLLAYEEDVR